MDQFNRCILLGCLLPAVSSRVRHHSQGVRHGCTSINFAAPLQCYKNTSLDARGPFIEHAHAHGCLDPTYLGMSERKVRSGSHTWEGHVEDIGVVGVPGNVLRGQFARAQVVIQQAERVEAPLQTDPNQSQPCPKCPCLSLHCFTTHSLLSPDRI